MKKDYCKPCAEAEKKVRTMKLIHQGADQKITCAVCGRRRYGATYEVGRKGSAR